MDKPVDSSLKRKKRLRRAAIAATFVLAVLLDFLKRDGRSTVNLGRDKITLAQIRKDGFQDYIAIIGAVEPIQIVYLDATAGGRVEEIFIREGTAVKKGDPILRIANDKLLLEISSYETEVARAVNDLRTLRVTMESPIGTINILDTYKLSAEVDEHFIARIRLKLKASCEFSEREYPATVSKIYPEVKNGKFAVNLVFSEKVPTEIRIGQTSRIRLELGESQTALPVPRGGFHASTGGQWIYVVDPRTHVATKRTIKIGRQNPGFYEVLEGLEADEEVITSGYETLGNMDKMVLHQGRATDRPNRER